VSPERLGSSGRKWRRHSRSGRYAMGARDVKAVEQEPLDSHEYGDEAD